MATLRWNRSASGRVAALLLHLAAASMLGGCETARAPATYNPTAQEARASAAERAEIDRLTAERAQERRRRTASPKPAQATPPSDPSAAPAAQVEPAPPVETP